jgi:hypothetical protein
VCPRRSPSGSAANQAKDRGRAGERFVEADPVIAKFKDDKLGAADDIIGSPRAFDILPRRFAADPEDQGDFHVRLPRRRKSQALELAAAEMRRRGKAAGAEQPARCREGVENR